MSRPSNEKSTVALLSPCGWGNLGDAAIVEAAIEQIRARQPSTLIVAFTLNPADTTERHQIPAFAIDAFTLAGFGGNGSRVDRIGRLAQRLLCGVRAISGRLGNVVCRTLNVVTLPVREVWHWWSSYRVLRRCRSVVICGGGQIDEFWGGPWGHPYALFKFALVSRLARARVIILSSGSAELQSKLGKWFVARTLRMASYRSFREHFAVKLARELGAPEPNLWFPDLAFSLDCPKKKTVRASARSVVGVSPIAWLDPRSWPAKDAKRYENYVQRLADFVRMLLARKNQVVLFATAGADHAVIADLLRQLRVNPISGSPEIDGLLTVSAARTVPELMEVLAHVDLVVASRLHGVLLSYASGIPTVALSYDPKVDHLVETFHQENACLPIGSFEGNQQLKVLDQLDSTSETVSSQLRVTVAEFQERLKEQYDRVFGQITAAQGVEPVKESTHVPAEPVAAGMASPSDAFWRQP